MTHHRRHQQMMFDILNNFDFQKVHDTMKCLNWTWYPEGIPTVDNIVFSARERIESVIKNCLLDAQSDQEYYVSSMRENTSAPITNTFLCMPDLMKLSATDTA